MTMNLLLPSLTELLISLSLLLLLHYLRRTFSLFPLYMTMALFLIISLVIGIPNFSLASFVSSSYIPFRLGTLLLPMMTMDILIYETIGTREAQKLIFGLIVTLAAAITCFFIMIEVLSPEARSMITGHSTKYLTAVLFLKSVAVFTFVHLVIIICIPIIFQAFRNWGMPFSVTLFVCLGLIYVCRDLDTTSVDKASSARQIAWVVRLILMLVSTGVTCLYLKLQNISLKDKPNTTSFFDEFLYNFQSTDRMRKSLEEWEERYQLLLDHSPEIIIIIDQNRNILNANATAINIFGPYFLSSKQDANIIFDEELKPLPRDQIKEELLNDPNPQAFRFFQHAKLKLPDDTYMDIDFTISIGRVDDAPVFIIIMRDMTEQRKQERLQQELQEQLVHSQRLESIGVLAGGIAHDFNNLLHSIQGSSDALALQGNLTTSQQSLLTNINSATKRASRLTSQLLAFARKGKFHIESIDLQALIEQTAQLFQPTAKNIKFKVIIEPDLPTISGDATQLQQVLLNLLINARDALNSNTENPRITLRAQAMRDMTNEWNQRPDKDLDIKNYVCIKVKDNGCGMDEETQKKIFEPFFTTKEVGKGTGMGLAMAYGCILHHHGWITLESTPGV
ncbi:MAG: PAS domain-containing protein, partial [Victivallales bacterium]|nr:PAS domain-containing protein [Victivallales bacterium]